LADVMAITKWSIASGGCDEDAARKGMEWMRQRYRERGRRQFLRLPGFTGTNIGWFCIDFRVNHRFRRTRVTGKP
jgi:hypothetical protein